MHTERAWPQRSRCFVSSIVVLLSQRTQRLLGAYLDSISQAALTPPLILNASCLAPSPATILVPMLARERLRPRPGEFPHITSRAPSQPDVTLPQALLLFALPLSSRNRLPKRAMAPRNATTPLSPLSPDSDQAPGLSRTPSFLGFAPKRAMASFDNLAALANYGEHLGEARKIVWREQGRATRRAAGPVGVSRAWRKGRPRGGRLGVRYSPGCQSDPAHDLNRQRAEICRESPSAETGYVISLSRQAERATGPFLSERSTSLTTSLRPRALTETCKKLPPLRSYSSIRARVRQVRSHARFVLNALPPSPGRGAPAPPARARSSATPFSTPCPLPRTLPSLTTLRRPRPVPLDGRADTPGVAVQANVAIILRARGHACESLRESWAADRDRAADVEGWAVLTVSPSLRPPSPIRAPRYRQRPIPSSHPRLATRNRLKLGMFANGARPHALMNSSVARRLSARNASQRPCLLWQADDEQRLTSTPSVTRPWVGCAASV
ncbi:hypothetical protein AcV7_002786 [Taiwanofungus camphoratus]|nr:hypothetical protein AcV7_002786 [Antrodia cinnamomea]